MDFRKEGFDSGDFINNELLWAWITAPTSELDEFWNTYIASNPEKKKEIEEAIRIIIKLNQQTHLLSAERTANIWKVIKASSSNTNTADYHETTWDASQRSRKRMWYKVAAIIALVIVSTIAIHNFTSISQVEVTTAYGETSEFFLPDSSRIVLNSNSRLSYSNNWNNNEVREVWLDGEALFQVKHLFNDKNFIVHVNNLQVKVIGTTFNVENRRGVTKVVLNEGKVNLLINQSKEKEEIELKPGDLVEVSSIDNQVTRKIVNPEIYSSWVNQKLIFNETRLAEIVELLEDIYGFQVEVEDTSLLNHRFTGTVPSDNLEVLFRGLEEVHLLSIEMAGDNLQIRK